VEDNMKLGKDSVAALTKASTVFINYLSATAHDVARSRGHKTIAAADVLKALEIIEFGDLVPGLEEDLEVYREGNKKAKPTRDPASRRKGSAKDENAYKGKIKPISSVGAGPSSAAPAILVTPSDTGAHADDSEVRPDEDAHMEGTSGAEDVLGAENTEDEQEDWTTDGPDDAGPEDDELEPSDGDGLEDGMEEDEHDER